MIEVGVYEAKTQLTRLIARVAQGERVTITRHGKAVAMLVPPAASGTRALSEVLDELAAFSKGRRLRGLSIRAMRDAGRR